MKPDTTAIDETAKKEMLIKSLEHALDNMSRDQHATMTDPTYEEACKILQLCRRKS